MKYINIDKNQIPYEFELVIDKETFQFEINYNSVGDFFTVSVKKDHELVLSNYKAVYGVALFDNLRHLKLPRLWIFPYDTTGKADRISYENLNEDVFLYVLD